ncbi:Na(+)/H(+) exchange regulatory cofactor NHE-RF1-like [Dreissena polymorpha]|nr:Na(+)/H(+) exchange regulatory cofactor NHE-RF1-like [Dreissena polymorpha]
MDQPPPLLPGPGVSLPAPGEVIPQLATSPSPGHMMQPPIQTCEPPSSQPLQLVHFSDQQAMEGETSADEDDKSDDRPPRPRYNDVQHDQEEVPSSPEPEPEPVVTKASVKLDLPADDAGLRKVDQIIEVNNIEDVTHQQKIKTGGEETNKLVVDPDANDFHKNNGITITVNLPEVINGETNPKTASAVTPQTVVSMAQPSPLLPEGETSADEDNKSDDRPPRPRYNDVQHDQEEVPSSPEPEPEPVVTKAPVKLDLPADDAGLRKRDQIIEVNNIEDISHQQKIKTGGEETNKLVVDPDANDFHKNNGITITVNLPEVINGETNPKTASDKLPKDVQQLDDKAITLFYKALEHGKEKVNNIRLLVVGMFGVGKTSLVNNLIWDYR